MKGKEQKTMVIGSDKYTALGYFYMLIKDSYKADTFVIKSDKMHWHTAEVVIALCKLNGWQENEMGIQDEKEVRSRCTKCNKSFTGQHAKCIVCGSNCNEYSFQNKVCTLEKIGPIQAHQEELLKTDDFKMINDYIALELKKQNTKDSLIMRRWG